MLRRLGLQLARSGHVGNQGQVHQRRIAVSELVAQLTHRLDERQRLDVAHRTADFGDDDVVLLALSQQLDAALDFVSDVRDDLHGLAEILAFALLFDDALVDFTRRDVVRFRRRLVGETLVVSEIEVGFGAVLRHVTLAVLVGVERPGVDVDVGVELLDGHRITARLQQARNRCRDNPLAERRGDTACHEYVLGFRQFHVRLSIFLHFPVEVHPNGRLRGR